MLRGVNGTGGTAPVGGSGTIGTVPVWATATTLGNSLITQSGSNVGIGAPSPGYRLDVAGTTGTGFVAARFKSEYATAALVGTDSSTVWFGLGTIGNANCIQVGTNFLNFRTNGSDAVRIDASGNVTIGLGASSSFADNRLQLANNASQKQGLEFRPGVALSGGTTGSIILTYDRVAGAYQGTDWNTLFLKLPQSNSYFDASSSGSGLKLPATPGNSDTQTLDAYKENTTWAPTVTWGTGGTVTTTSATGAYTQTGNVVTFTVTIAYNCTVVPTGGSISIDLPRASASGFNQRPGSWAFNAWNGVAGTNFLSIGGASTTATLRVANATGTADIATNLTVTASGALVVTGTYLAS